MTNFYHCWTSSDDVCTSVCSTIVAPCFFQSAGFQIVVGPFFWPVLRIYARPGRPGSAVFVHLSSMFLPAFPVFRSATVYVYLRSRRQVRRRFVSYASLQAFFVRGAFRFPCCAFRQKEEHIHSKFSMIGGQAAHSGPALFWTPGPPQTNQRQMPMQRGFSKGPWKTQQTASGLPATRH